MVLNFRQKFQFNSRNLLRECGYLEILDYKSGKISYVKKLQGDHYPRFHVYVSKEEPGYLQLNMHLDMKKPSYEGFSAHSGEYEGPLVEQEATRISQKLESLVMPANGVRRPDSDSDAAQEQKKTFWGRLFG